jgi:hypothetical protein
VAAEGVVTSSSVVVVEPVVEGGSSLIVAGERLPVGPFGLQGAVEAFCLAVLPGAVGSDPAVLGADRS